MDYDTTKANYTLASGLTSIEVHGDQLALVTGHLMRLSLDVSF